MLLLCYHTGANNNNSADPNKLTDSNGFQQVPVTAFIESESIQPKSVTEPIEPVIVTEPIEPVMETESIEPANVTESVKTPTTLDLSNSDFFASDPGEETQSQTNETEKIMKAAQDTSTNAGDDEL